MCQKNLKGAFVLIGVYDYTVILTYCSMISAMFGIIISTSGAGHPYWGAFFLLFSGLCDTFDGIVARKKPNRTEREKSFGVQIDSLSDLVAFGVLPSAISVGLYTSYERSLALFLPDGTINVYVIIFLWIVVLYALAGMIRLAYFNVLDEERKLSGDKSPKGFVGLPITSAALIFPVILLLDFFTIKDLSKIYFIGQIVVAMLFLGNFRLKKPGKKMVAVLLGIGAVECLLLACLLYFK